MDPSQCIRTRISRHYYLDSEDLARTGILLPLVKSSNDFEGLALLEMKKSKSQ